MSTRYYYFVQDDKTREVLGMNLSEDEIKKLFYNNEGYSKGRSYGCTYFKIQSHDDFQLIQKLRKHFKNSSVKFSYLIMLYNECVGKGIDELEEEMLETIKSCMHPKTKINVYEITSRGLEL